MAIVNFPYRVQLGRDFPASDVPASLMLGLPLMFRHLSTSRGCRRHSRRGGTKGSGRGRGALAPPGPRPLPLPFVPSLREKPRGGVCGGATPNCGGAPKILENPPKLWRSPPKLWRGPQIVEEPTELWRGPQIVERAVSLLSYEGRALNACEVGNLLSPLIKQKFLKFLKFLKSFRGNF